MDSYMGSIVLWPLIWAPEGWLFCNGQILQTNQYQALFSLLGNQYGGDGNSTFALPNFNGRVPVGVNAPTFPFAQVGGNASNNITSNGVAQGSFTITSNQLPVHTHTTPILNGNVTIPANNSTNGNTNTPGPTAVLAKGFAANGLANYQTNIYSTTVAGNTNLAPVPFSVPAATTGPTGSNSPVNLDLDVTAVGTANTIQPWTAMSFIMCVNGIYPPRP